MVLFFISCCYAAILNNPSSFLLYTFVVDGNYSNSLFHLTNNKYVIWVIISLSTLSAVTVKMILWEIPDCSLRTPKWDLAVADCLLSEMFPRYISSYLLRDIFVLVDNVFISWHGGNNIGWSLSGSAWLVRITNFERSNFAEILSDKKSHFLDSRW